MHQFTLEPIEKVKLDKNRFRVKHCPCDKKNKDGKFVPFKGFEDRGYCHSCGSTFSVGNHTCPGCKKAKAFNLYVDTENCNCYLNDKVGKCLFCSYHFTPKEYFEENCQNLTKSDTSKRLQNPTKSYNEIKVTEGKGILQHESISFIPIDLFKGSLKSHSTNCFIQYLINLLGTDLASIAISRYFIGSSSYQFKRRDFPYYTSLKGATVFWQIDIQGRVRGGKIMLYSPITGKRVKDPFNHITWVHSALKLPEFHLQQCMFGEHLLKAAPEKIVAIVESEKTAVIASMYLPDFVWLACGSLTALTAERLKVLQGRNVILYPDLNGFEKWSSKAKELSHLACITVSDLLESKATSEERGKGLDLADYLTRFSIDAFLQKPLQLYSNDFVVSLGETRTGKDFNNLIIAGFKDAQGEYCDILFNECGEFISPGEQSQFVNKLAAFFHKRLQPAFIDNCPCLIHIINSN